MKLIIEDINLYHAGLYVFICINFIQWCEYFPDPDLPEIQIIFNAAFVRIRLKIT